MLMEIRQALFNVLLSDFGVEGLVVKEMLSMDTEAFSTLP